MAKTTSLNLNDRWTQFIAQRIEQGRFESASEAVRAGLRLLEIEEQKLDRLLAEIAKGIESGPSRPFVRGEAASLARSRAPREKNWILLPSKVPTQPHQLLREIPLLLGRLQNRMEPLRV